MPRAPHDGASTRVHSALRRGQRGSGGGTIRGMAESNDGQAMQVVLSPAVFELFKEWVDRELGGHVFRIPGLQDDDDLPSYGIGIGRH